MLFFKQKLRFVVEISDIHCTAFKQDLHLRTLQSDDDHPVWHLVPCRDTVSKTVVQSFTLRKQQLLLSLKSSSVPRLNMYCRGNNCEHDYNNNVSHNSYSTEFSGSLLLRRSTIYVS